MLVVFGGINVSFVFPVPSLPRVGETMTSTGGRTEPAGKGASQAVAAAFDGARVTMAGAVGNDVLADGALAGLIKAGVDVRAVARLNASTGRSAVCVDPEGYTMVATDPGANLLARANQVSDGLLGPATTLLLQMETEPTETALLIGRARRRGARVILNLSPRRIIDADALRAADLLIGSSDELAWLGERLGTGNNPASLHAALGVATVRMMGPQGAEAVSDDGFLTMPVLPVNMRDTSAAADCFVGVLAAALMRGAELGPALRRASVAAGLSASRLGAGGSFPSAREIDSHLGRAPHPTDVQPEVVD